MAHCAECGKDVTMPYRCKFCGQHFCDDHRLPENHGCTGLEEYKRKRREGRTDPVKARKKGEKHDSHIIYTPSQVRHEVVMGSLDAFRVTNRALVPKIVGLCVAVFALQILLGAWFTRAFMLYPIYAFSQPWTLFTHMLLHASIGHIFFNMWILYIFGTRLEQDIGSETFITIFLLAGLSGGLAYVVLNPGSAVPALGASGAIYGVFGCLAILRPNLTVLIQFLIPMRLIHAAILYAAIDLMQFGSADNVGHAAHLAGILVGFAAGKYLRDHGVH